MAKTKWEYLEAMKAHNAQATFKEISTVRLDS
jgi:hypothetical protein